MRRTSHQDNHFLNHVFRRPYAMERSQRLSLNLPFFPSFILDYRCATSMQYACTHFYYKNANESLKQTHSTLASCQSKWVPFGECRYCSNFEKITMKIWMYHFIYMSGSLHIHLVCAVLCRCTAYREGASDECTIIMKAVHTEHRARTHTLSHTHTLSNSTKWNVNSAHAQHDPPDARHRK